MGSDAEHHSEDAVPHQAEVPPPLPLPLLCCHLLCVRLVKLLPVTHILMGVRADGREVKKEVGQMVKIGMLVNNGKKLFLIQLLPFGCWKDSRVSLIICLFSKTGKTGEAKSEVVLWI